MKQFQHGEILPTFSHYNHPTEDETFEAKEVLGHV